MTTEQERISALATAVNVLKGQGGGYTKEEKERAAEILNKEFADELTKFTREVGDEV